MYIYKDTHPSCGLSERQIRVAFRCKTAAEQFTTNINSTAVLQPERY